MKNNIRIYLYCLSISFLFLMISSKCSFLYPFNDWMDANCFFTIGKSLLKGKIFYVDFFDQKGPLLFLYHTIAAIISYKSFIGIFIIEVFSFSIFLWYAYKLCQLFLTTKLSLFILPILSFIILTLPSFSHGDSAEEFCLPFLMYSLYHLVSFLKREQIPTYKTIFMNGVTAGFVATIKYTMLGFWFAFMMCSFLYMIYYKTYKRAFISCFIFLMGLSIPITPWIFYFSLNHALQEFIDAYILFNIKYYTSTISPILKLFLIMTKPITFIAKNLGFGIFLILGTFSIFYDKNLFKNKKEPSIIIITFIFLCVGIFIGGISFRYYYLILTPFCIFGLISITKMISNYYNFSGKNSSAVMTILVSVLFMFTFYASDNTKLIKPIKQKEDFVQYQFAKNILKIKNPTILNYGFLDGGFFTVTGTLPTTKYYQMQNIDPNRFPEMLREQNHIIKSKKVNFIITRNPIESYKRTVFNKNLKKNYKVIDQKNVTYEEHRYRYTLWKRK